MDKISAMAEKIYKSWERDKKKYSVSKDVWVSKDSQTKIPKGERKNSPAKRKEN
jgi:hypothetical protein